MQKSCSAGLCVRVCAQKSCSAGLRTYLRYLVMSLTMV